MTIVKPASLEFFPVGSADDYVLKSSVKASVAGGPNNMVVINFLDEDGSTPIAAITKPGTYNFHAKEGAIVAKIYGPSYDTDPTDYTEWTSPEIVAQYEIAPFPAPTISPAPGNIEKFENFTLTMPEGFQLFFVNDRARSYIYPILPNGSRSTIPVCSLICTRDFDVEDEAYLNVREVNGAELQGGYTPEPGKYVLVLANSILSGMYNGDFVNAGAFEYEYTVTESTGIDGTPTLEIKCTGIHTLDGVKLNATPADLPAGLYIIDGKKVLVK